MSSPDGPAVIGPGGDADTTLNAAASAAAAPSITVDIFNEYIVDIVSNLLNDVNKAQLMAAVQSGASIISNFIVDQGALVMAIERTQVRSEEDVESFQVAYVVRSEISYRSDKTSMVAFLKEGPILDAARPLNEQLNTFKVNEGNLYDAFVRHISAFIKPLFKSFVQEARRGDQDGDKLAPAVEKSLDEVVVGLLHMQQNIDIPEIELVMHPKILEVIEKAEGQKRRASYDDVAPFIEKDQTLLNQLSNTVTRWIQEIQKVTHLDRDAGSGTALQEVTFWMNMDRALRKLNDKVNSEPVQLTLQTLKVNNRFHATALFDSNTKLKEKTAEVADHCTLLKDLPLNEMLSAQDFKDIIATLTAIFMGLKKVRSTKYPLLRLSKLVETLSRDIHAQLIKVIGPSRLLHATAAECDATINEAVAVFEAWDTEHGKLFGMLRQMPKQKREEFKFARTPYQHNALRKRLESIRKFRKQDEQLRNVITRVIKRRVPNAAGINTLDQCQQAYDIVKQIDYLDVSKEGDNSWNRAISLYDTRISHIENDLATRLRDQLGGARSADEMFAIFAQFNALFVRPHIRSAIREYQTKLIERVKEDIARLTAKLEDTEAEKRAIRASRRMFDYPEFSGFIMWMTTMEENLRVVMNRVAAVLGDDWGSHVDGRELKNICDRFLKEINTDKPIDDWMKKMGNKEAVNSKKIFTVEKQQQDGRSFRKLTVNFAEDLIDFTKNIRALKSMKHDLRIPFKILNVAQQANQIYPYAVSLSESVRCYDLTKQTVQQRPELESLTLTYRNAFRALLEEGAVLVWESYRMDTYVAKVAEAAAAYQDKVDDLINILDKVEADLASLATCEYSAATIGLHLTNIQKNVDELTLGNFANLNAYMDELNKKIETQLAGRCEQALRVWTEALKDTYDNDGDPEGNIPVPRIHRIVLEIRLNHQMLVVVPSIEQAREHLTHQMTVFHGIVSAQQRVSCNRIHRALARSDVAPETYKDILTRVPQQILFDVHTAIDAVIKRASNYVNEWTRYQALWELPSEALYDGLGNDLNEWMKVLVVIKRARHAVDAQETTMEFKPIVVDYGKVQSKVSNRYDVWHREVLQRFGSAVGGEMSAFYQNISTWRKELESQSIDSGATSDAVALITYVQSLKRQAKECADYVERFRHGQRLLTTQRYQFPANWLYAENIEGEWSALEDILHRKDAAIQGQIANLQTRIKEEDAVVEKRVEGVLSDWDKAKPIQGNQRPRESLLTLEAFEDKISKLREDRDNMVKAKNALEISDTSSTSHMSRLDVSMEELEALKSVWNALAPVYDQVDELKEKTWLSVQPRKIRQTLDELLTKLKQLPSQYRSYEAYEYAKTMLQNYAKVNLLVTELKSEALKERHWKQLMKELRVQWNVSELQLGQVWDADLIRHDSVIKQVLLVAQGELALEEFLKQVREYWQNFEVELIGYQNKTRLIRGWDDLFNKLKEHMNSLAAMKLSPYYKQFEDDALAWEDRLSKINALFDVWIDVQRRWVYLEGLFSGSADIATLLPTESNRFASASSEFLAVMRKVSAAPRILDVVHMQGAQRLLERLAEMLAKILKALGDYLERQRSSFPRFYFVGDEDLLEIMGNSKDVIRVMKHLKKMFAGIMAVEYNEDLKHITAMVSREGERVEFVTPIDLEATPRVNDWLQQIEDEMRRTLTNALAKSLEHLARFDVDQVDAETYMNWLDGYPAQIIGISADIWWADAIDKCLSQNKRVDSVLASVDTTLALLSDSVLRDQTPIRRKKIESLITEFVHKRDITRRLVNGNVTSPTDFHWLQVMRYYFDPKQGNDPLRSCTVKMANAEFAYGFEYLGIQEKLVQTPLTDRCYLTMTQALHARLGGSPFGPAGTGKTESVKALGQQLGRFVLVFNCDETFDFQAVGRILVGLCQVGAWGCFDEFNRLEERMLSAVSQQIQTIQEAVRAGGDMKITLVGKRLAVDTNMAIFITMNPGYSGRSNLPDNLKQLFRSLAMTQPDRQLIAEVMLFSQGFRTAEPLAKKIVPLFILCKEQLSNQCHYDFGLRALKYVLVSAGNIKRDNILRGEDAQAAASGDLFFEQQILIQSVCETLVPKLVSEDITLLFSLLQDVFPDVQYVPKEMTALREAIGKVCDQLSLSYSAVPGERGHLWLEKVLQLYQITNLNHGLMLVGSSGTGKSMAWKVLLKALEQWEKVEGVAHVIDAKAMSKDSLYGVLDANTREWTDGLFTHIIRKILDNVRGEADKRQWIIFDGDVDPEWVENLNSVLDDNKLLTLPNGERLSIPSNVRLIFEVADLKYATLATVSRCGMVWFAEEVVTADMLTENYLERLRSLRLDSDTPQTVDEILNMAQNSAATAELTTPMEGSVTASMMPGSTIKDEGIARTLDIQNQCANAVAHHLASDGFILSTLDYAIENVDHIMEASKQRLLLAFFAMMNYSVRQLLNYDFSHRDFPLTPEQIEAFISRSMVVNAIWAFSGDGRWKCRQAVGDYVRSASTIALPPNEAHPIIDYYVTMEGEWAPWAAKVPQMEVEAHRVTAGDIVVPTMDTVRHELLLNVWLSERKPLVLCGPPGSGKTMTLLSALRSLPDLDVINVNFSSSTTPELLLRTFDHYCEYRRTPNGVVLSPAQVSRWLVIFCDEINLPTPDKYGTQRVISFMRQLVEQNGFYRTSDQQWVTLERIQFVGACNPPTDPGRNPMSLRFLRHVPVVYVDYPGQQSLIQIYGTFVRAIFRRTPSLRNMSEPITSAMVDFYLQSQARFTQDDQPHYVYSPRELTRWVRGISEAIAPLDEVPIDAIVRLWGHEALRLFHDRLVHDHERQFTEDLVDTIAGIYFDRLTSVKDALKRPLLFSNWLSANYAPVSREDVREYVAARLRTFYEEELDVKLVLFDQLVDHVLRIDRIFRQPQGHVLLIGVSGAGKTTLSRFVAWINGIAVFQLKVHSGYSGADFDEDIRHVLRRAGCKNERICFIMDESNMLDTGFLERLNTLLANGEVPGLFEGEEHTSLMNQIKEGAAKAGHMLDSHDELYKYFTAQVIRNLHVVFTMNPSGDGLRERASTSPALFNRCVLNWFGDWSDSAFYQVGDELTHNMDIHLDKYVPPAAMPRVCDLLPQSINYRNAIVNAFVQFHNCVRKVNEQESRKGHRVMALTPRHYLDFIQQFSKLFHEKRHELEEERLHLNIGLSKIQETEEQVQELQKSLKLKSAELERKKDAANSKLKEMLNDQQKAEKEKEKSEKLQAELATQLIQISSKTAEVHTDLSEVEPAVNEAKEAVKGIRKQQLVELKSMQSPPSAVKLAMESLCLLLGENVGVEWKQIRSVMVKEDFISRILQFDTDRLTPDIIAQMEKYKNNADWDFDKVNRASTACGPMLKWVKAQLLYADMLNKVEPLRNELKRLQKDAETKTKKGEELKTVIAQLEQSIAAYKEEYAALIGQAETIKTDLATVQEKVGRSIQLLSSLRSESERWNSGCDGFSQQMETLVGDATLSGAFLAYSGYYDQHVREVLFHKWVTVLQTAEIKFRGDLARIEYLSSADDRVQWTNHGLPKDELCTENAIMLHRFNRYPLIIDPSGQAVDYLMKEFAGQNIMKTSFLDMSFKKHLETALRFGTTLLVQDVESYDPVLNPVLNREVKRAAGRVLMTLGGQDIDLSPAFKIFLLTRDSSVEFAPDLASRVTFVNFTITRGSLEMQCLHRVLKSERPDIDEKRNDLLKLQGEFAVRLRQLEKALLAALNESKGRILDDDSVIATLEQLKTEAKEVARKAAETDQIMAEVEAVTQRYVNLAHGCSLIYLTLLHLNDVHFLYHYSLDFVIDMFTDVLKTTALEGVTDHGKRLEIITNTLFQVVYRRVSQGMLHTDKVLMALLLLRIYLKCHTQEVNYEGKLDHLLLKSELFMADTTKALHETASKAPIKGLTQDQVVQLMQLARLPEFKTVVAKAQEHGDDLAVWMKSDNPEHNVPELYTVDEKTTPVSRALNCLLVIHALRPDRVVAACHLLVSTAFGPEFMQQDKVTDLQEIIEHEVASRTPVLLCSVTGFDASGKVEDLAVSLNKDVTSIAIGSSEGFSQAEKAIESASKSGRWVLLKNVHLAPTWLSQIEKRLHVIRPQAQFRLILTAEIHPKLPVSVLSSSRIVVFEPATGLKANVLRSLSSLPPTRISKAPVERARLYFLVCWFHALVQERLRYRPLGWAHAYEFSDADLRMACDTLDHAVDSVALGRSNLSPDKLPWQTLRTIFSQCIYGGKIDNRFDQTLLDCFLARLFSAKAFDNDFVLINNVDGKSTPLRIPEAKSRDQLFQWANDIKQLQMPSWIGLPNNAEKVLLTDRGQELLRNMLKMSDDELAYSDSDAETETKAPSWMITLSETATRWLSVLPTNLTKMKRTKDNIKDPLFRFFEREVNVGLKLSLDVQADLSEVLKVCKGTSKQNNHLRSLISALNRGQVPPTWNRYTVPQSVTVIEWMSDFVERAKQLVRLSASPSLRDEKVWLGGLFAPEAYITATRQMIAQTNGWSLEQLHMHVRVGEAAQPEAFTLRGLRIIGAACREGNHVALLTDEIQSDADLVSFTWTLEASPADAVPLPVYLYTNRSNLLFTLNFIPENFEKSLLYERGVAIACNSQLS
uniref:Dynein heavy chain, cytoplasmic n=1 Tax=Panagrellus redivivus TaxID=6233 RepID=A0A7E4ZT92_PANRE